MSSAGGRWRAPVGEVARLLLPVAGSYLDRQRWVAHVDGRGADLSVRSCRLLQEEDPAVVWMLVDRGPDVYQLLVGLRPADQPLDLGERDVLGTVDIGGASWFAYEGLADATVVRQLAADMGVKVAEDAIVRPVSAEQSNSSVVIGQEVILKLFRRLQAGTNPDVEVTTGLDRVGFNHLASPLGVWSDQGYDLAVAQEFLAGGSEGWALALTSLRDLYASGDDDPAAAGGDFAGEARRIGEMTARMHVALRAAFGVEDSNLEDWARTLTGQVDQLGLGPEAARTAERLSAAVASLGPVPSIRVHGDLHLGQVMRAESGWFVLDFEGEPSRPVAERRLPWPAAKDVAGMLRSFDYAAAVALREHKDAERDELAPRGRAWEQRSRAAFLDGYRSVEEIESVLPPGGPASEADRALLELFELDKAVYEVTYERAHRPDWADIPLSAIERLAAG